MHKMAENNFFCKWFPYTMVQQVSNIFESKYIEWEFVGQIQVDTE